MRMPTTTVSERTMECVSRMRDSDAKQNEQGNGSANANANRRGARCCKALSYGRSYQYLGASRQSQNLKQSYSKRKKRKAIAIIRALMF